MSNQPYSEDLFICGNCGKYHTGKHICSKNPEQLLIEIEKLTKRVEELEKIVGDKIKKDKREINISDIFGGTIYEG